MTTQTSPVPTAPGIASPASTRSIGRGRGLAALVAMAVTSFILITAEFLPGGLLTLIAADLGVTAGQAGQAVTVTALAGLLIAPTITLIVPGLDRRVVMTALAALAAVSDLAVALAPNLLTLLLSRLLIGAAIGGFWSLSLAVVARITSPSGVARGMMIVNVGNTLASVIGVPLGIWASGTLPWRDVFVIAAGLSLAVAIALLFLLPVTPAGPRAGLGIFTRMLRRPGITPGLIGHVLVVLGHMGAYAFIRVGLERIPDLDAAGVGVLLTAFGVGGFLGNLLCGLVAARSLRLLSAVVPVVMGMMIGALALFPSFGLGLAATALWGASFGGWLVVVNAWIARVMPDELETGGSLVVVGFQLAIVIGAAAGGWIVDQSGAFTLFLAAGAAAIVGGIVFAASARSRHSDGATPV
ncbi:MFS transporter [Microbacterium nymphoidis]|uniref:MFS transporter n=1 Tax=Microbacterium nymphoidis TaxID=2898586 RepID=UPI001E32FFBE|nr:MFS transporter [Microbacterium nymphoidis]MCD2498833.1 MFS transporter [Microbacterium nymphoidis]